MIRGYRRMPYFDYGMDFASSKGAGYNSYQEDPMYGLDQMNMDQRMLLASQLAAQEQAAKQEQDMLDSVNEDFVNNHIAKQMARRDIVRPRGRSYSGSGGGATGGSGGRGAGSGKGSGTVTPSYTSHDVDDLVSRMEKAGSVQGANAVLNDRSNKNLKLKLAAQSVYNQRLRERRAAQKAAADKKKGGSKGSGNTVVKNTQIQNGFQRASYNFNNATSGSGAAAAKEQQNRLKNRKRHLDAWRKNMSTPHTSNFNRFIGYLRDVGLW